MPRRAKIKRAEQQLTRGLAYDVLARELVRSEDFQTLFQQLALKLKQDLLQQIIQQPLQQLGTSVGAGVQDALFGQGAAQSFSPSTSQIGAALHELLADADAIL
jgi:hypothetical protein